MWTEAMLLLHADGRAILIGEGWARASWGGSRQGTHFQHYSMSPRPLKTHMHTHAHTATLFLRPFQPNYHWVLAAQLVLYNDYPVHTRMPEDAMAMRDLLRVGRGGGLPAVVRGCASASRLLETPGQAQWRTLNRALVCHGSGPPSTSIGGGGDWQHIDPSARGATAKAIPNPNPGEGHTTNGGRAGRYAADPTDPTNRLAARVPAAHNEHLEIRRRSAAAAAAANRRVRKGDGTGARAGWGRAGSGTGAYGGPGGRGGRDRPARQPDHARGGGVDGGTGGRPWELRREGGQPPYGRGHRERKEREERVC